MTKLVRIIALIMAILMGLSAIGMIAMYVAAESYDGTSESLAFSVADVAYFDVTPARGAFFELADDIV